MWVDQYLKKILVKKNILRLESIIQKLIGKDIGMQHGPSRLGDIRKDYLAITKVREKLG